MPDIRLSDETLNALEEMSRRAAPPPWRSMVEGRDHTSGNSFIRIGVGEMRGEDMHVLRDGGPAQAPELDLIAAARNSLPDLIAEIRSRRRSADLES
jgi:hypothetical protein